MSIHLDKPGSGVRPVATGDAVSDASAPDQAATPVSRGDDPQGPSSTTPLPSGAPLRPIRPSVLSAPRLGGVGLRSSPLWATTPKSTDVCSVLGDGYARLSTGAGLGSVSHDPPVSLPRAGLEELSWAAGPLLWGAYVGTMEARGKQYYYWMQGGQQGPQRGAPNWFYRARLEGGPDTDDLYHAKVFGLGTPLSYLGSHVINQALRGKPVLADFDPVEMVRHTAVTAVAEDALYWGLMNEPIDLMWLRGPLGDSIGDTFGKPSELANIPYAYYFGLGAAAAGAFARHRVAEGDQQNLVGWGGDDAAMSVADTAVHGAHWMGALIASVPMVTGQPLSPGLKAMAPVTLSAGWIHGFADVQAGVHDGNWWQTAAGVSALLSTYFQTSVNAAHAGVDARGYDCRLSAPQLSIPALGFAALSIILDAAGS